MIDALEIEKQARDELAQEQHRVAVEEAKARIRARRARPWWSRLFPYQIQITKRD